MSTHWCKTIGSFTKQDSSPIALSYKNNVSSQSSVRPTLHDNPRERNIAFFIQVSSSTVPRLYKLLEALYHPKNVYAIHLDKKIPESWRRQVMRKITTSHYRHNVHFMESEPVTYRGTCLYDLVCPFVYFCRH